MLRQFTLTLMMLHSAALYAHGSNRCCGGHEPEAIKFEEIPLDGLNERQYRQMLDDAHHAIESEGLESAEPQGRVRRLVRQWRNNFQFKRNILNAYRWYSSHRGVPYAENAAANIAGLLLTSHAIETVGGWTMAAAGAGAGFDSPVEWAMTTLGVTISIPGLDPLCIVLIGAYKRWPAKMDQALTVPRMFAVRLAKTTMDLAGVPEWYMPALWQQHLKEKFIREFQAQKGVMSVRSIMDRDLQFHIHGPHENQTITLFMHRRADGRQGLRSVSFSEGVPAMVRTQLARLLAPFGSNIRHLVLEMDKFIAAGKFEAMAKLPYVEKIDRLPWRYTILLKDNAFPFFPLTQAELTCEQRLTASAG